MKIKEFVFIVILFLLLTSLFAHKVFLGYIPLPTDLIVGAYHPWYGRGYEGYPVGVPVKNPKLSDAVSIFYPLKELAVNNIKSGELPLWNPYMFGGYPLFANVQLGLLFPTMAFYIFPMPIGWTLQTLSQPFLAGVLMYLLLRHLKLDPLSSVFGGIAYGFGGYMILWMQWNTQATTALMLPGLILFEDKYLQSRKVIWGVLFSLFICFQIFAGYLPVLPPTYLCLGIWYIFRSRNYFKDLSLGFFAILGFGLSAVFTVPVAELILNSQRGVETLGGQNPFTHPGNLITLFAPDFFGNDATGNFWGIGDHMDFTLYTGVTTLVLAIIGVKEFFKKSEVKFAVIVFALAIFFSIQNPFSEFLYNNGVWGGTSITMNRINFLINFALAMLGAFGLSALIKQDFKFSLTPAIWIFAGAIGILAGLYFSRLHLNSWIFIAEYPPSPTKEALLGDFDNMLTHIKIAFKNLILPTTLTVCLLISFAVIKWIKYFRKFAPYIFILILVAELFRFGWKFNVFSEARFAFPKTPLSDYLQQFPNDRFAAEPDILPANMWVPFKISSMAGYDGLYPLKAAKILAVANTNNPAAAPQPRWGILQNFNSGVLDATNTKFILASKLEKGVLSPNGTVNYLLQTPNLKEVYSDNFIAVLENKDALPRAYLTAKAIQASDSGALHALMNKDFPLEQISLTESFSFANKEGTVSGQVDYQQITNSHFKIKTQTDQDSFLVVLDGYYPGWKAFIDGTETLIHRTNYDFKGVVLPKGNHTVDLRYQPKSLFYGTLVTAFSILILILSLISSRLVKLKN